ncbi:hypothetical protein OS493_019283, partial [Desmophyllum pertusum]
MVKGINATVALGNDYVECIFEENQFGIHDPEAVLSRTMWFLITLHFGQIRSKTDEVWRHRFEKKMKRVEKSNLSGQPRGRAIPAM